MKKELLTAVNAKKAKQKLRSNLGKHLICPRCNRKKYIKKLKGQDKRYFCTACRHKFSLKTLIGFKHSNLDFRQIYHLLHSFGNNKTIKDAVDWAGTSVVSARFNYSRIREKLALSLDKDRIWGHFACDECFVGRQKYDNQALVIGAVDQTFSELRLKVIEDQDQGTIEKFIYDNIEPTSMIVSDGATAYLDIEWMGYGHDWEYHNKGQFEKTVPIERVWALFKTLLTRSYHHIWKEKLPEYAVEFQFKFIHRKNRHNPLYLAKYLTSPVPNP